MNCRKARSTFYELFGNCAVGWPSKDARLKVIEAAAVTSRYGSAAEKRQLPAHGKGKELGKGLVEKIKKDLGLK